MGMVVGAGLRACPYPRQRMLGTGGHGNPPLQFVIPIYAYKPKFNTVNSFYSDYSKTSTLTIVPDVLIYLVYKSTVLPTDNSVASSKI